MTVMCVRYLELRTYGLCMYGRVLRMGITIRLSETTGSAAIVPIFSSCLFFFSAFPPFPPNASNLPSPGPSLCRCYLLPLHLTSYIPPDPRRTAGFQIKISNTDSSNYTRYFFFFVVNFVTWIRWPS